MRVWVVTGGLYSSNRIVGVYSTKQRAKQVADIFDATGVTFNDAPFDVEPWDLDDPPQGMGFPRWVAQIRIKDGQVVTTLKETKSQDPPLFNNSTDYRLEVYSDLSLEHAITLAKEARQQWLREQALKENP